MDKSLINSLREDWARVLLWMSYNPSKETIKSVVLPANVITMPATNPTFANGGAHSLLDRFCTLIRNYEGIPGDQNYLNNNPGNCRYNEDGYLTKYEPVTKSPAGFAVFPSYEIGWMYLENMITQRIENHPNWTLLEFFQGILTPGINNGLYQGGYAPASDGNNPELYAAVIAKGLGVDSATYQIKNILV